MASYRHHLFRSASFARFHSTTPQKQFAGAARLGRRALFLSVVGGAACCYLHVHVTAGTSVVHADSKKPGFVIDAAQSSGYVDSTLTRASLSSLLRSYFVYAVCSFPAIVNCSPTLISVATSVPGLKQLAEAVIRHTFFTQFVGGDTAEDTLPVLAQLRRNNVGALLAYSVEVDEHQANSASLSPVRPSAQGYKANVEETIRSIDVAADFEDQFSPQSGRKTWVAVKLTALLPSADSLVKLSNHLRTRPSIVHTTQSPPLPGIPDASDLQFLTTGAVPAGLTPNDYKDLKELYDNLNRIAERAYKRNVKLIIDAEYTWYQPAIDAFTLSLMYRYNKISDPAMTLRQPIVYNTYQAYLKRTPEYLTWSLEDARKNGYAVGIKLVRGAYHHFETEAAPSTDMCPVWGTKVETDQCFDNCAQVLVAALSGSTPEKIPLGILFGTHNITSCNKILHKLLENGLAKYIDGRFVLKNGIAEHSAIAQLYGMSDALTASMANEVYSDTPFIIKYIPYGPLTYIMPYLGRRAVENSSILSGDGGATAERKRIGSELYRRVLKGLLVF